jgi:hypothetical protein
MGVRFGRMGTRGWLEERLGAATALVGQSIEIRQNERAGKNRPTHPQGVASAVAPRAAALLPAHGTAAAAAAVWRRAGRASAVGRQLQGQPEALAGRHGGWAGGLGAGRERSGAR